jgi:hypothetical protein
MAVGNILSGMIRGLFFANHASNYLPIRVRMPSERDKAVEKVRTFARGGECIVPEAGRDEEVVKGRFVAPISPAPISP